LHSEYSLLDGACRIDRLVDKAAELKFPALALTDHGVMYGAIDFYQAAREQGIKPIIGCEVYVAPGSRLEKKTTAGARDVYHHLIEWAKDFGLKLVATNDVHYIERGNWRAHDCLICIGTQTVLSDTKRMKYVPEQFYLRTPEEMAALFSEVPEALANTLEVAEKCDVKIEFGKLHYPVFTPPEHYTREGYLRKLLAEGLYRRYTIKARAEGKEFVVEGIEDPKRLPASLEDVLKRLDEELRVIEQTGFESYFLIVGDFVQYGRSVG